jgi:hypothetical protein
LASKWRCLASPCRSGGTEPSRHDKAQRHGTEKRICVFKASQPASCKKASNSRRGLCSEPQSAKSDLWLLSLADALRHLFFEQQRRVGILAGHFLSEGQTRAKPQGQTFGGPQLSQGHTASRSLPHVAATCLCVGERRGAPRLCAPGLCRGQCPSRPRLLPFGV